MASVTSLDKDLRNMRLSKYTPQAANEIRDWIEEVLGERLPSGDLLDILKDGVVLCKLVNLAAPTSVKYKASSMPFVQMENISHFLRAIQQPPIGLHPHDVFLTVDLYEAKDPAQVLTCLGAFSRRANSLKPSTFNCSIGPKSRAGGGVSPQRTGGRGTPTTSSGGASFMRERGTSGASQASSTTFNPRFGPSTNAVSPTHTGGSSNSRASANGTGPLSPHGATSSWSKKSDESSTTPAWNIHQYGYMGGASQGNQGISFGARRQITSAAPSVPSIAERERKRREEEAEQERLQIQAEEADRQQRLEREAEEERERIAEQKRWEEETRKQREKERLEVEAEKRRWQEEELKWREEEERRVKEEKELEARLQKERQLSRTTSDTRLTGQFLSQYQAEQRNHSGVGNTEDVPRTREQDRVRELERELQEAREREKQYQRERDERLQEVRGRNGTGPSKMATSTTTGASDEAPRARSRSRPVNASRTNVRQDTDSDEHDYLQSQWKQHSNQQQHDVQLPSPPEYDGHDRPRPLPDPTRISKGPIAPPPPARPLPDPAAYASKSNRTDQFLATNAAPAVQKPQTHFPDEMGFDSATERHVEDSRRAASQTKTKAGGWASKSLLEREMERERQRQQEWEEGQKSTQEAAQRGVGKGKTENTVGEGGSWDVNQYGWTGGDSQNRGGVAFGGRRQIIGPRPPP
ncbi:MAG: hypothetical protein M1833_001622 [Piccolia ochrophora]|nr:MAG: hypothetical protein M1833_001622 [Piccolia ochrophora]